MRKHCPTAIFALLLSIFLALPAWGFGLSAEEEGNVHTIIEICDPADYGYTLSVFSVKDQAALQALVDAGNNALQDWFCMDPLNTRFGRIFPLAMPVSWDLSSLDFTRGGLQFLRGQIRLGEVFEDGVIYQLGEGLQNQVSYPIYVEGTVAAEDVVTLRSVESMAGFLTSLILPADSDPRPQISTLLQDASVVCFVNDSIHYSAPVDCITTAVNSAMPGLYPVSLIPKLPEGLVLPQGFSSDLVYVGVVKADCIDLSAAMYISSSETLQCTFLYTPENPAEVNLEYSTDGAITWKIAEADPLSTSKNPVWSYANYNVGQKNIDFPLSALTPGVSYAFRFTYDQDQTSNVLNIRLAEGVPQFKVTGMGGDVDGSDQGQQEFPPIEQPAPSDDDDDDDRPAAKRPTEKAPADEAPVLEIPAENPAAEDLLEEIPAASTTPPVNAGPPAAAQQDATTSEQSPVAEQGPDTATSLVTEQGPDTATSLITEQGPDATSLVTEQVTATATSLSGTRLNAMAALADTVLFEKQGVSVLLPSEFVKGLALKDSDLLTVTIDRLSEDSFSLLLEVNGVPLSHLPEMELLFPWEGETADLICVNENGDFVSPAVFNADSGAVSCLVSTAGVYHIQAAETIEDGDEAAISEDFSSAGETDSAVASSARSLQPWLLLVGAATLIIIVGGLALLRRRRHE